MTLGQVRLTTNRFVILKLYQQHNSVNINTTTKHATLHIAFALVHSIVTVSSMPCQAGGLRSSL